LGRLFLRKEGAFGRGYWQGIRRSRVLREGISLGRDLEERFLRGIIREEFLEGRFPFRRRKAPRRLWGGFQD